MRVRLPCAFLLFAVNVAGCQCFLDDNNLNNIPDAGEIITDAGPPPPKFPLKAGDHVQYSALGGRTATCAGSTTPGDCQRSISAEYVISDTVLDAATSRWTVVADVVYQGTSELIEAAAIAPLVLENGAPFGSTSVATPTSVAGASFLTDAPATDQMTSLGFPFFQFQSDDANVFEVAGTQFCDRYTALDASAACRVQVGDQKMEVFYKDDEAGGGSKLHKVRAEYHNMGLVCGWDEGLIPFQEGVSTRTQADFDPVDNPDIAAIFFSPKVIRDGKTYICDCFSQHCSTIDGTNQCLSTDPDKAPCACSDLVAGVCP